MSRLNTRLKRRLGYILYLIEAFRIWATSSFPLFEAVLPANGTGGDALWRFRSCWRCACARLEGFTQARSWSQFAQRQPEPAGVQDAKPPALSQVPARVIAGRQTFTRKVELLDTPSIECRPRNGSREALFVEADGEVLGSLPVRLEVIPHSLTLLVLPARNRDAYYAKQGVAY